MIGTFTSGYGIFKPIMADVIKNIGAVAANGPAADWRAAGGPDTTLRMTDAE
jgi:hypothetical protein